jgi:hypothetical protein
MANFVSPNNCFIASCSSIVACLPEDHAKYIDLLPPRRSTSKRNKSISFLKQKLIK